MNFATVCSGIEAPTVAWQPLGWRALWYSEIAPFPCTVLDHHYPDTPNLGDMTDDDFTARASAAGPADVLVGGTPCQDFSLAGLRKGLAGARGALTMRFVDLVSRLRPRWLLWENVPGVLSSDGGRAFGAFTQALGKCGYRVAWRVLDAQYFGVPQRRRRVFLVGHSRNWRASAAVLFERSCLSGHSPKGGTPGQDVARCLGASTGGASAKEQQATFVMATGQGNAEVTVGRSSALTCNHEAPVAFTERTRAQGRTFESQTNLSYALTNPGGGGRAHSRSLFDGSAVRRLTPRECERLQGFPDDYTLVPYRGKAAKDTPRYRAIGNSMAVPVVRWIGERMQKIDHMMEAPE